MKVLFINNALTHYFKATVSKISKLNDIDLIYVCPTNKSISVGKNVYEDFKKIDFKIKRLEEFDSGISLGFRGLSKLILREKPDVIITGIEYARAFYIHIPLLIAMRVIKPKFVIRSIPYGLSNYSIRKKKILHLSKNKIKNYLNLELFMLIFKPAALIKFCLLEIDRYIYKHANAHINYIDSYRFWMSYGVDKKKIFISRNSPDSTKLRKISVSVKSLKPLISPNFYRMIHVGRLTKEKRVDLLIQVLPSLIKKYPKIELLIIGSGPEEENLRELARNLNVLDSIYFVGEIYNYRILGRYFSASSLYVLAGIGGLSINDAMSFGLPVLCSKCDGTEKFLVRPGKNGAFFKVDSINDLTRKIIFLFSDKKRLSLMGKESAQIIEDEVNINTVINVYKDMFKFLSR